MYLYSDASGAMMQAIRERLLRFRTFVQYKALEDQFHQITDKFPTYTERLGHFLHEKNAVSLTYWDVRYNSPGPLPLRFEDQSYSLEQRICFCMVQASKNLFKSTESRGALMMLVDPSKAHWYLNQLQEQLPELKVVDFVASCISKERSQVLMTDRLHFICVHAHTGYSLGFSAAFNCALHIPVKATLEDKVKGSHVPPNILQALTKHLMECGLTQLRIVLTLEFYTQQNILLDLLKEQAFLAVGRGLSYVQKPELWKQQGDTIKAHIQECRPDVATIFDPPQDPLSDDKKEGVNKVLSWYKRYATMDAGRLSILARCRAFKDIFTKEVALEGWHKRDSWKTTFELHRLARRLYISMCRKMKEGLEKLTLDDRASIRVATYHKGFATDTLDEDGEQRIGANFSSYAGNEEFKAPPKLVIPPIPGEEEREETPSAREDRILSGFKLSEKDDKDLRDSLQRSLIEKGKEFGLRREESLQGINFVEPKKKRKLSTLNDDGMEPEEDPEVPLQKKARKVADATPKPKKRSKETTEERILRTGGRNKAEEEKYLEYERQRERQAERKKSKPSKTTSTAPTPAPTSTPAAKKSRSTFEEVFGPSGELPARPVPPSQSIVQYMTQNKFSAPRAADTTSPRAADAAPAHRLGTPPKSPYAIRAEAKKRKEKEAERLAKAAVPKSKILRKGK